MGNIMIKGLPRKPNGDRNYTYSDLTLDITPQDNKSGELFQEKVQNDIKADYDVQAIINSIQNLFTTAEGQKLLNPEFGLDLTRYLFNPATKENAKTIKREILTQVARFEPRVKINGVSITVFEDVNEYDIDISIGIPALNIEKLSVFGTLQRSGYVFTK